MPTCPIQKAMGGDGQVEPVMGGWGDRWYSLVLLQCLPSHCSHRTSMSVLVQIQASLSVPFAMGYSDRAATREHPK